MPLCIVCVDAGDYEGRGVEYVNKLHSMVTRNLAAGMPGRFIVYTDRPDAAYNLAIHRRELPADMAGMGWWAKIRLFAPGEFHRDDRVLYFDLDTVIVGDLDAIAAYDGPFAILRDFNRRDGLQSSVMIWKPTVDSAAIWHEWNAEGRPQLHGGDQEWIELWGYGKNLDRLQDLYPDTFVSYKLHGHPYPAQTSRVVVFHGQPRPHECGGWVAKMWAEGPAGGFSVALERNTHLDVVRKQSAHSATRGLPRLTSKPAHAGHAVLVGGGPSVADMIEEIRWRSRQGQMIWALNGTHDWLIKHGITPAAMVLLDARPENARFIRRPHHAIRYYLASQCHKSVYDALHQHDVVRFDLEALGDCGTTVGTHAMNLAWVEGFRQLHLYGFDSSYREAAGHAYAQPMNDAENVVEVTCADRTFRAAPWMFQQAQDFQSLARDMTMLGGVITVHGDGLLPYLYGEMARPQRRTAADERAKAILDRLVAIEHPAGAEIGVFAGDLSLRLLAAREDLSLLMVDSWEGDGLAYATPVGDWHEKLGVAEQDQYCAMAKVATRFAGERAQIVRKRSCEAAADVPDGSLDFVFIDADHSYEGCGRDILAWWPKVKAGGVVGGHDYANVAFPEFGVTRAVDEFAAGVGQTPDLGENFTWFLRRS